MPAAHPPGPGGRGGSADSEAGGVGSADPEGEGVLHTASVVLAQGATRPAGHCLQGTHARAPGRLAYAPAEQLVHATAPTEALNQPALQAVHTAGVAAADTLP